jgi:hypothetical protein
MDCRLPRPLARPPSYQVAQRHRNRRSCGTPLT